MRIAETSVRTSITVEAPIERAFKVFTEEMGTWWDSDHHLVDGFERMEVQLREGGHIIDHGRDGMTCRWARVLAYEPPSRFVFSWDIAPNWHIETDPRRSSEVEVRFLSRGPDRTHVELEHKHLDRHGDGWESVRDAVGSPDGWNLTAYAAHLLANPRQTRSEHDMKAVLIEVNVAGVQRDAALEGLRNRLVPAISSMPGFVSGTWLTGNEDGRGLSLTVWDSEQRARAFAVQFDVGSNPQGGAAVERCEIREVAATA